MELPTYTKTFHRDTYPSISPARPELSTRGKNIVITGGGSGIGAATVLAFAESGAAKIAVLGRTERTLQETKQIAGKKYPHTKVDTFVAGLEDSGAVNRALSAFASTTSGKLNVLVANAGVLEELKPTRDADINKWWHNYEVNVKTQLTLVRAFLSRAVEDAVLINISSALVHFSTVPKHRSYRGSKLAAVKMFDYLQEENPSLTVIQYHPGVVETSMGQKSVDSGIVRGKTDTVDLPASFAVWCASNEAHFLKHKFVWANWDVDELKDKAQELQSTTQLTIGLLGWP